MPTYFSGVVLGILIASTAAFAAEVAPITTISLDQITVTPPSVTKVKATLSATQVAEIELLGQARITEPKLTFDVDFGYGLEVYPDLMYKDQNEYSYVSDWICQQFGYGKVVAVEGERAIQGTKVLAFIGNPRDKGSPGPTIRNADAGKKVAASVVCQLK